MFVYVHVCFKLNEGLGSTRTVNKNVVMRNFLKRWIIEGNGKLL